jgi:hypothetical protein
MRTGSGRTFGAGELAVLGQELETAAAAGDVEAVPARVDELDGAWARAHAALVAARDSTP